MLNIIDMPSFLNVLELSCHEKNSNILTSIKDNSCIIEPNNRQAFNKQE